PSPRGAVVRCGGGGVGVPRCFPRRLRGPQAPGSVLRIGCMGVGRMGRGDMKAILERGLQDATAARVVALCDVDARRLAAARELVLSTYAKKGTTPVPEVAVYRDFRELLARADLDAVTISTPDHWHALHAVAAAEAKKAIYVQKPLTYSVVEGQRLVAAVRGNGVVLQVGSQQRSDARFRRACELVRNG